MRFQHMPIPDQAGAPTFNGSYATERLRYYEALTELAGWDDAMRHKMFYLYCTRNIRDTITVLMTVTDQAECKWEVLSN